ncbi:cupin-like domain-containing protein [Mesonia aquimarina]|uniref:cupin-like domain-containing protein n=1 Tax=Mesonia aquimarina TaxID=1504967 RepID=UPI000EF634E2|nr:cupin-like domain-containing protein [Mesonia aquimarina]
MKNVNGLYVEEIPRVKTISKKRFVEEFVKPQKPLVIEELTKDWDAYNKWNLDYIQKNAGNKTVPLFDNRPASSDYKVNEPHAEMRMEDYIKLLKTEPTDFRIFLYSLLKEVPALQKDFNYPDIGLKFLKRLPFLFFGGQDSKVFMHYDIDYANIMHFHFHGKKRCLIYPPSQTPYLYKVPHALISREDIDFSNPNFDKWPALKKAKGFVADLNHGEALYMPEGYWHYMHYKTPGFSMSLRSIPKKPKHLAKAAYNVFVMRHFDNFMRKLKGQNWIDYKDEMAYKNTHRKNNLPL